MSNIPTPYLIFVGDAADYKQAKVACGVSEWRPDLCVGQLRFPGGLDLGLPDMGVAVACQNGAKTLVIGVAPFTTELPQHYIAHIMSAIDMGMDIANPLHDPLPEELVEAARVKGIKIHNFRHRDQKYPKATGLKRPGLRLLTVGTDCACGKKYTAVALTRALAAVTKASFRSTGQTGFLISESGINNDTIQADFLSGAAEWLSPANDPDHWDVIEGQGALSHPSFGAGALSLIYGSQPDLIVMCHEPGRAEMRGITYPLPDVVEEIRLVLRMAQRTNPNAALGAVSLFTKNADPWLVASEVGRIQDAFPGVTVFDPALDRGALSRFAVTLARWGKQ